MNWTEYFMNIAESVKLKSKDRYTQIGAVIVGPGNEIVSTGYNSFPRGIYDEAESRQDRPEKYYWFAHAELNAIFNAARIGVSTDGCTMYMTCGMPCTDCAKGIINAGIKHIVCSPTASKSMSSIWDDHAVRSEIMFSEAGVTVTYINGH